MRDLVSNFAFTELLVPQTLTANTTSNALDLRGFDAATLMFVVGASGCLLYTSPSPRDRQKSRMPSSA